MVARDERTYTVLLDAVRFDFDRLSPQPLPAAIEEPIFRAAANPRDYAGKSAFNTAPDQPGLWNGRYLVTGFAPNQGLAFTPNPYWDGKKPAFGQISMRLVASSAAMEASLLPGEIDVTSAIGGDQTTDLQRNHRDRFGIASVPNVGYTNYLVLQRDNPILGDKRVRHAIAMAIDKQAVVERLDSRVPVAKSILAGNDPNYDKDVKDLALRPCSCPGTPGRGRLRPGRGWDFGARRR